jgi:hypothetical protein
MLIYQLLYKQKVHYFCIDNSGIPCFCKEYILNANKVNMMFVLLETILQIPQFPATWPCFFLDISLYTTQQRLGSSWNHRRLGERVSPQQVFAHFWTLTSSVGAFLCPSSIRWRIFFTLPPSVGEFWNLLHPIRLSFYSVYSLHKHIQY